MADMYKRIDELLAERGITGAKMSSDLGMSRSFMTELRKGRAKSVKLETAQKIADYFDVSVHYLLGEADYLLGVESGEWCVRFRNQLAKMLENANSEDALASGTDIQELWSIAEGTTSLSFDKACEIADALGVSIDHLLGKENKKAPTEAGERALTDAELKFALFGSCEDVSDDDLADVRRYAAFVRERKKDQK